MSSENSKMVLRLYVAGKGLNSAMAIENLKQICRTCNSYDYDLKIVDVLKEPQTALDKGIFVTPALEIIEPAPGGMVYGTLADKTVLKPFFPSL
ncbi:Circadian clock protein KaiB [Sedimentisphaera cyanobacteriorum]|uniref:Circadian clock protein KaiB n=1 Tax=Sedimentisphaera cyanobacteriorum TaxID=1940790 RepID=A0A1Q2HNV8_9BACT|nr:circadian clock KaiB family protein [Sedimentisphaera cyanobacteriorum]AQQ08903.1 Circadian clock protein KaiB [Sedimentisphaera cyanobacteriorum]